MLLFSINLVKFEIVWLLQIRDVYLFLEQEIEELHPNPGRLGPSSLLLAAFHGTDTLKLKLN
jgi:hypothetical protein